MLQLSFWAREHKTASRCIIAISQLLLFIGSVSVAILLDKSSIKIASLVPASAALLMIIALVVNATEKNEKRSFRYNYVKRKSSEFVFLWSSLVCICFIFNNQRIGYLNNYQPLRGSFVAKERVKETPATSNLLSRKELKKQFKELLKELKKKRRAEGKGWLIALVILGGVALSFVVLGLACNISCNGNDALGTVVLFGGLAAVILLMVLLIRKINRSERVDDETNSNPATPALGI